MLIQTTKHPLVVSAIIYVNDILIVYVLDINSLSAEHPLAYFVSPASNIVANTKLILLNEFVTCKIYL